MVNMIIIVIWADAKSPDEDQSYNLTSLTQNEYDNYCELLMWV